MSTRMSNGCANSCLLPRDRKRRRITKAPRGLPGPSVRSLRAAPRGNLNLPYAAQCLETGLPGNTDGYRVDYPGRGLTDCGELREWLEVHESTLAKDSPTFS